MVHAVHIFMFIKRLVIKHTYKMHTQTHTQSRNIVHLYNANCCMPIHAREMRERLRI